MAATLARRLNAKQSKYRPLNEAERESILDRQVFRGFTGGNAVSTSKGYRGVTVETSWSQSLILSFENDDIELAKFSLKSQLADLKDTVEGGIAGCPYSIGDFGFYSEQQFQEQSTLLKEIERENTFKRKLFFSETEWQEIDRKLDQIAHFTKATFSNVQRGDTFSILAVRKHAFLIARYFLQIGVDPMIANEDGKDTFDITKDEYKVLSMEIKKLYERQQKYLASVRIRTELYQVEALNQRLIEKCQAFVELLEGFDQHFQYRKIQIDDDNKLLRRCELLNHICPPEKIWNVSLKETLANHQQDLAVLMDFLKQRIDHLQNAIQEFLIQARPKIRMKTPDLKLQFVENNISAKSTTSSKKTTSNSGLFPPIKDALPRNSSSNILMIEDDGLDTNEDADEGAINEEDDQSQTTKEIIVYK
jgi:hypothetical protein